MHGVRYPGCVVDMTHETIEEAAAIEHARWARWQEYLHSICVRNPDGSLTIPADYVTRWERQIATPYADLSEREKDADRNEVRKYLHLFSDYRIVSGEVDF